MPKFLHLADVHLGFDKYNSKERTRDFFDALLNALEKYAIAPQVDFVLIAGDLFEDRQVLPSVLNQAQLCLSKLQEANIPVFAIEGNHDYRPYGSRSSWLSYLNDWEYLKLLEPEEDGTLSPWNVGDNAGGYYDLDCGVRVIGSQWYGASAPTAIKKLADQISALTNPQPYTVMMFHHGLEGFVSRYAGALRYEDFMPLREVGVDYLALGHIHRAYEKEGWIFNPGSIEANSIVENQAQNPRGVYLVDLSDVGVKAQLKRDYQQREIVRLAVKVSTTQTVEDVQQDLRETVQCAAQQGITQAAIVELKVTGRIGFDRLEINVKDLKLELQELAGALIFLLKYEVTSSVYETYLNIEEELPPRREIERSIFQDFLATNARYREQAETLTQGLMDLKEKALADANEAELYDFVTALLPSFDASTES